LIKNTFKEIKPSEEATFIDKLREMMVSDGERIPTGEGYDVIIIGAGVAGTQAALILTETHKVLVIDRRDHPSSFGVEEFFLNTGGIQTLKNSQKEEIIPTSLMGGLRYRDFHSGPDSAKKMANYLIVNLFQSGADILLKHWVIKSGYSNVENFPLMVETQPTKIFYTKRIIEALGPGKPINPFPHLKVGKGPQDSVLFEDDFISMVRDHEAEEFIQNKRIAVIGGGPGGQISALAAVGLSPQNYVGDESSELRFQESKTQPRSLTWIGKDASFRPSGLSSSPIMEAQKKINIERSQASEVIPQSDGTYLIKLEHGDPFIVDKIVLAAGRHQAKSIWDQSHAQEAIEEPAVTKIEYTKGEFIGSMLETAIQKATSVRDNIGPSSNPMFSKRTQRIRFEQLSR
jgi:thioredoxin reductase